MATRRDTAHTREQSDPSDAAAVSHSELLPALREYRTSDLQPSTPRAHAHAMMSLAPDLGETEDTQAQAGRTLQ